MPPWPCAAPSRGPWAFKEPPVVATCFPSLSPTDSFAHLPLVSSFFPLTSSSITAGLPSSLLAFRSSPRRSKTIGSIAASSSPFPTAESGRGGPGSTRSSPTSRHGRVPAGRIPGDPAAPRRRRPHLKVPGEALFLLALLPHPCFPSSPPLTHRRRRPAVARAPGLGSPGLTGHEAGASRDPARPYGPTQWPGLLCLWPGHSGRPAPGLAGLPGFYLPFLFLH